MFCGLLLALGSQSIALPSLFPPLVPESVVSFFLLQTLPPGDWHCPNCTCKFCGLVSVGVAEGDDSTASALLKCSLCEKKCKLVIFCFLSLKFFQWIICFCFIKIQIIFLLKFKFLFFRS